MEHDEEEEIAGFRDIPSFDPDKKVGKVGGDQEDDVMSEDDDEGE